MMKGYIIKFIKWLLCSFERGTCGASSRKITICVFTVFAGFIHYIIFKNPDPSEVLILGALIIDCVTILLIMQIIKAQDIVEFVESKNGTAQPTDDRRSISTI